MPTTQVCVISFLLLVVEKMCR